MTSSLFGGKGAAKSADAKGGAIGEVDAHVFNCPACARPLSDGTWRCPGCGTRMVLGVALKRAALILVLGIAIGGLIGGGVTAAVVTTSISNSVAGRPVDAPLASTRPTAAIPSITPVVPVAPRPVGRPATAIAALSGTAVVNGRIAVDTATLASTLADRDVTTIDIARALRSLAADAALGLDLVGRLEPWTDAEAVGSELDAFYRTMADTARLGLRASLSDGKAYRNAGGAMLKVLSGLGTVDASSRTLAATVDLELPPVVPGD